MVEENIAEGDIVVVRRQDTAEDGDRVVALINGYETTLKKYYRETDRVRLQPANPRLKPRYGTEPDSLQIQGKVVSVAKAHRSS